MNKKRVTTHIRLYTGGIIMTKNKKKGIIVQVLTDKQVVSKGADCTRILEVDITAPKSAGNNIKRPLELAIVIDRSGSMRGEKLHYAKRAAAHLVDLLTAEDRAAIVMYDNEINTISPSLGISAKNREQIKSAIQCISSRGSTNLFDGWLQGCREIADSEDKEYFKRTLLLSDGLANQGITDIDEIATHVRELAARDISTSCFGIGLHYNEHLLEAIANAGGGAFHFLEAMSAIPVAFEREFDELIHTTLSNTELSIKLLDGVHCEISAGWPCTQTGNTFRANVGSLYAGRALQFYFQLHFPQGIKGKEIHLPLTLLAKNTSGKEVKMEKEVIFMLVKATEEKKVKPDKKLLERFALVDMADRATEALKMARAGRRREATEYFGQRMNVHEKNMPKEQIQKYQSMMHEIRDGMDERTFKRRHTEEYFNKKTRADVRDYRLHLVKGHLMADIDGRRALIDTGIPISLGREDEWLFMQHVQPLSQDYMGIELDEISRLVGAPIDVMVGMDILKRTCVRFELQDGQIGFSTRPTMRSWQQFALEELMGVPSLRVDINGKSCPVFLDTGAKLCYVSRDLLQGLQSVGKEQDFYPCLGTFETDVYQLEMSLGDMTFTLPCGVLPSILEATLQVAGKEGIIGTALFEQFRIEMDMQTKRLLIKPRQHHTLPIE